MTKNRMENSRKNKQPDAVPQDRHRRNMGRVTLKDVAKRAGVGAITVSRALRTPEAVSETLRARIDAAVDELGYVPNRLAGSLASANTQIIPVIVPSLSNAVFAGVLRGIENILGNKGFQVLIANTEYSLPTEEAMVRALLEWAPAGIILAGVDHTDATRRLLSRAGIPVVEMMELGADPIDMVVGFSHFQGGFDITTHLLNRGYRRIGFVGTRMDRDLRAAKRLAGGKEALAGVGLQPVIVQNYPVRSSYALGGQALQEILSHHPDVDAVFFSNDDLAVGAVMECIRQGIPIPDRVAIVGFNGLEIGQYISPRLTTVLAPRVKIGETTAEKILSRILGEDEPEPVTDVGYEVLERETT